MSNNSVEVVVRPIGGSMIGIDVSVRGGVVHLKVRNIYPQTRGLNVESIEAPFEMTIGEAAPPTEHVIKIEPLSSAEEAKMVRALLAELALPPNEKPLPPSCEGL